MDLLHIRLVNSGGDMKTKTVKRQEILLKLETELKELNNWLIQVNRGREYPVSKTSRMILS